MNTPLTAQQVAETAAVSLGRSHQTKVIQKLAQAIEKVPEKREFFVIRMGGPNSYFWRQNGQDPKVVEPIRGDIGGARRYDRADAEAMRDFLREAHFAAELEPVADIPMERKFWIDRDNRVPSCADPEEWMQQHLPELSDALDAVSREASTTDAHFHYQCAAAALLADAMTLLEQCEAAMRTRRATRFDTLSARICEFADRAGFTHFLKARGGSAS